MDTLPSPLTLLDSPLFGRSFVDDDMRALVSAQAFVQRCLKVEVALARGQARLGVIPGWTADGIAQAANHLDLDLAALGAETEIVGYPVLPLVERLAEAAGEAGRYLHWGATTQDIMDTATILQVRDALDLIDARLATAITALASLARDHRTTPMAGRTHLQQALPITFGYKAAVWLAPLLRHRERLAQVRPRVLVVQFSGAAGTLASLGDDGLEVQAQLARELGLGVPSITWHASRDGIGETVQLLALIMGSLAKVASDISIMSSTEFGEVSEPFARHRGASSTMPQKRNPVSCELILAAARMVRQHSGLMLDAMIHDFERATGPWHLEWAAVPESFGLTSGALVQSQVLLEGLVVHRERMAANLDLTQGLIVAEAAMMALAPGLGRQNAHDLVYAACQTAAADGCSLGSVLEASLAVRDILTPADIARLTDPANYLGSAPIMVDRALSELARPSPWPGSWASPGHEPVVLA